MHNCLTQKTKWWKVYKWWRKSLTDHSTETPDPLGSVVAYEEAVFKQYGVMSADQKHMIFRYVWEELDLNLLPLTKMEEDKAEHAFWTYYWRQDCALQEFVHKWMQLLWNVELHKGDQWMNEDQKMKFFLK